MTLIRYLVVARTGWTIAVGNHPRRVWLTQVVIAALLLGCLPGSPSTSAIPRQTPTTPSPSASAAISPTGFDIRWQPVSLPVERWPLVQGVVAGSHGFVAVGYVQDDPAGIQQGAVWTSIDGQSWHRVKDSPVFDGAMLASVIERPTGELIATGFILGNKGENGSAVWTSMDGDTWTRTLHAPGAGGTVSAIAAEGQRIVAVGSILNDVAGASPFVGAIWVSTDGAHWDVIPGVTDAQSYDSVAAGPAGFIAIGDRFELEPDNHSVTVVALSSDGTTWHQGAFDAGPTEQLRYVASAPDGWLGIGDEDLVDHFIGSVFASADGSTWSKERQPGLFDNAFMSAIGTGPLGIILGATVGGPFEPERPAAWQSTDGITWRPTPDLGPKARLFIDQIAVGMHAVVVLGSEEYQPSDPRLTSDSGQRLWLGTPVAVP